MDKDEIRRRAVEKQVLRASHADRLGEYSLDQIQDLVKELEVHQIELEMQNLLLEESAQALRNSRQRYMDLYTQAPVGYLTLESDATIAELNPAAEILLRQGDAPVEGQPLCKYVRFENQDSLFLAIRNLFETGEPIRMELGLARKDDQAPCHISLEAKLVKVSGTSLGRFVILDVSERRILQDQVARSQNLESVALLAGGVAHDFNNLMTVVTGCSELLLDQLPKNDPQRELVEDIHGAGNRAAELTAQLLDIGRRNNFSQEVLDLNSVVSKAARLLHRILPASIELKLEIDDQVLPVSGAISEIEQILINLVANASNAQPDGGWVRIQTERRVHKAVSQSGSASAKTFAVLSVSDCGEGISEEDQRRIF